MSCVPSVSVRMAETEFADYQIRPPHHQKFKCGVVKVGTLSVMSVCYLCRDEADIKKLDIWKYVLSRFT